MDKKLYERIAEYAQEITCGGDLPWQGLYTARSVYQTLKSSSSPMLPEEIAESLDISGEYANQVILALQNGGIPIKSTPGEKSWTGRPRSRYSI